MPTIQISEQAYSLLTQRAQETERSLDEVINELILGATEHPYIECNEHILNGKPVIAGTRIPVWQLAEKLQLGDSVADLCDTYPYLPKAVVYDAISYYFDNRRQINQQIEENQIQNVLVKHNAIIDERGMLSFTDLASK